MIMEKEENKMAKKTSKKSGFNAPVIGRVLKDGTTVKKKKNGVVEIVASKKGVKK